MQQGMYPQVAAAIMQPQDLLDLAPTVQQAVHVDTICGPPPAGLVATYPTHYDDFDMKSDDGSAHTPWETWAAAGQGVCTETATMCTDNASPPHIGAQEVQNEKPSEGTGGGAAGLPIVEGISPP